MGGGRECKNKKGCSYRFLGLASKLRMFEGGDGEMILPSVLVSDRNVAPPLGELFGEKRFLTIR